MKEELPSKMKWVLPIVVISQFFCTSLWFAGNSIMVDLVRHFSVGPSFLANITSAVQLGFIAGTLVFAFFAIADRYSPSRVFFTCSIIAAVFNAGVAIGDLSSLLLLLLRFLTGFFLAGIYPVGMKIASDYYQKGLGKSLGYLVGALVLGTASSHLIKSFSGRLPWSFVLYTTSGLSVLGGLCMLLFVPDGPYRRQSQRLSMGAFMQGFGNGKFRSVALGYFGHMWELYAFWAFVPAILIAYKHHFPTAHVDVPLFSFLIIGAGSIACVCSGILSQYFGAKRIATIALVLSGLCCIISPIILSNDSFVLLVGFLIFWGLVVIADSPLFSTLVAQNAPEESRGTSLTFVTCIGFSITIVSIQLLNILAEKINTQYLYVILGVGPLLGVIALLKKQPPYVH